MLPQGNIPEPLQAGCIGALSRDLDPSSCGACCLRSMTQIYAYLSTPRAAPVQPSAFASCSSPDSDSCCCSSYCYYYYLSKIMSAVCSIGIASFEHRKFAASAVLSSVRQIGSFGAWANPVNFNLRSNLIPQRSAVPRCSAPRLLEHCYYWSCSLPGSIGQRVVAPPYFYSFVDLPDLVLGLVRNLFACSLVSIGYCFGLMAKLRSSAIAASFWIWVRGSPCPYLCIRWQNPIVLTAASQIRISAAKTAGCSQHCQDPDC